MSRDKDKPDMASEKYQVSDPSVLFEDVWAEGDACAATVTCPTCGYDADAADVRCPRCFTLLVTGGCTGSCGTCGMRTCSGGRRER